jgi:hypothetical protein
VLKTAREGNTSPKLHFSSTGDDGTKFPKNCRIILRYNRHTGRASCKKLLGYVIRHFNVSSAGLKKLVGLDLRWDRRLAQSPGSYCDNENASCRKTSDTVGGANCKITASIATTVDFATDPSYCRRCFDGSVFDIPKGCFDLNCEFTITVDNKKQVDESNEGNNAASDQGKG